MRNLRLPKPAFVRAIQSRVDAWPKWLVLLTVALTLVLALFLIGLFRPELGWLPGLPTEREPGRDAFDESFWPGLYAGIVAGVVTGVVVGIIVGAFLLVAERQLESRHILREKREAYDLFRRQLGRLAVANDPPFRVPIDAEGMTPQAVRFVQKHSVDKPLWQWQELSGDDDDFLEKYRRFNAAATAFSQNAGELNEVLGLKVRLSDFSSVHPVNDHFAREMASYYLAKRLDLDQNRFLLLSRPSSSIHIGGLENTYRKLMDDSEVQDASAAYLSARSRLVTALNVLAQVA